MRRAFTLIELLVVVGIIAIVAAVLLPVGSMLLAKSKQLTTSKRMEEISTRLGSLAGNAGGPAFHLQRRLGLGHSVVSGSFNPAVPPTSLRDALYRLGHDPATPSSGLRAHADAVCARFAAAPPGRTSPLTFMSTTPWGVGETTPEPRSVRQSCELLSAFLLRESGVLPPDLIGTSEDESLDAYRDDRGREQPWNDRWGNPIVVAWQGFESLGSEAKRLYGSNRIIYFITAAAGERVSAASGDPATLPSDVWNHVLATVSRDDASDPIWNERSFVAPPWTNVAVRSDAVRQAFLSAPIELK